MSIDIKVIVTCSPPRSMTTLVLCIFPGFLYQAWLVSHKWVLNTIRVWHAITGSLGLSFHGGHCCGSQASYLDKSIGCFPTLKTFLVQLKLDQSEAALRSVPPQRFLSWSEVYGVFISRDLLFSSKGQPKGIAIFCIGILFDSPYQQFKRRLLMPADGDCVS